MNRGFLAALVVSIATHAYALWWGKSKRPPVLLLTRGEISVDLLPIPAASPRPLHEGLEKQPVRNRPVEPAPKLQAPPRAPEEEHVGEGRPERVPSGPLGHGPPPGGPVRDSSRPPETPAGEQVGGQRPFGPVPLVSAAGKDVDIPRKAEPASAEPGQRPSAPEALETPRPADAAPGDPARPHPPERPRPMAPATASSPQPSSLPSVERIQGVRVEARLLGSQKPVYPWEAWRRGLEGRVVLRLRVSAEGRVEEAKLYQGSGQAILDDAALRFAESLQFVPARRGGTPIPTNVLLPIRYRLVDYR